MMKGGAKMKGDKITALRTTKFGLEVEPIGGERTPAYRNASEQVKKFLAGKLPCEIEIEEETEIQGRVSITRARPTGAKSGQQGPLTSLRQDSEAKKEKDKLKSVLTSYTKDLVQTELQVLATLKKEGQDVQISKDEIETMFREAGEIVWNAFKFMSDKVDGVGEDDEEQ
jgi:hypothetical protein